MSTPFPTFIAGQTDPGAPGATAQVVYCSSGVTYRATPAEVWATGLQQNASFTNPTTSTDPNNAYLMQISVSSDSSAVNPAFTNVNAFSLVYTPTNGLNQPDANAKTSFIGQAWTLNARAAGQRLLYNSGVNSFGMGDCFVDAPHHTMYGGVDANGDEGQGVWDCTFEQGRTLPQATISSVAASTVNTTTSGSITASKSSQTVTVGSTTGLSNGQWVTIDPQPAGGANEANMEVVQVSNVTGTTFDAVFSRNHSTGVAVKPATVLVLSASGFYGQRRILVNLSAAQSYSTGTASASGSTATGVGTTWSAANFGDSTTGATNLGAISFAADDTTVAPFGAGASRLRDWYLITSIGSTTSLTFLHRQQPGIGGYKGLAASPGSYEVRPACRIMYLDAPANTVVLPWNTFTWTIGDSVICAISPEPDCTALGIRMGLFSAGALGRYGIALHNSGYRTLDTGFSLAAAGVYGPQLTPGWSYGIKFNSCGTPVWINNDFTQIGINFVTPSADAELIGLGNNKGSSGLYWHQASGTLELGLSSPTHNTMGVLDSGFILCRAFGGTAPTLAGGQHGATFWFGGNLHCNSINDSATLSLDSAFAAGTFVLTPAGLTATRTVTAPDASGTLHLDAYAVKTGAYTLTSSDDTLEVTNAGTAYAITLPAANGVYAGKRYTLKKTDANTNAINLTRAGSDTIDGATSYSLAAQYKHVTVVSDGISKWSVVANN